MKRIIAQEVEIAEKFMDKEYKVSKTYFTVAFIDEETGEYDEDYGYIYEDEIMDFEDVVREIESGGFIMSSDSRVDSAKSPEDLPESFWISTEPYQDPQTGESTEESLYIENVDGSLISKQEWFALLTDGGYFR